MRQITVAQRALAALRHVAPFVLAVTLLVPATAATAQPVAAASKPKVVIVVGPTHGATARYLDRAGDIADLARSLGANVVEVRTPKATWARVRAAAKGARIFIYLGHGSGWPSPYAPMTGERKNGLGLNPPSGGGRNAPVKYYGEQLVARDLDLASGAVVLLNHLCYASGNSEPGHKAPTWSIARQRVDNYAAGFLAAGAGAVLADGHTSLAYELRVLLGPKRNLLAAWRADPDHNGNERALASTRRSGFTTYIDPNSKSAGFYRALTTKPGFMTSAGATKPKADKPKPKAEKPKAAKPKAAKPKATKPKATKPKATKPKATKPKATKPKATKPKATKPKAGLKVTATTNLVLRAAARTSAASRGTLDDGTTLTVTGAFRDDSHGRTWAPVRTGSGKKGFVAAWLVTAKGSAVATDNVALRGAPRTSAKRLDRVRDGTRVAVVGSGKDSKLRAWLKVRTPDGKVGWMAAWYMRP